MFATIADPEPTLTQPPSALRLRHGPLRLLALRSHLRAAMETTCPGAITAGVKEPTPTPASFILIPVHPGLFGPLSFSPTENTPSCPTTVNIWQDAITASKEETLLTSPSSTRLILLILGPNGTLLTQIFPNSEVELSKPTTDSS
jgi:hypothetical protein